VGKEDRKAEEVFDWFREARACFPAVHKEDTLLFEPLPSFKHLSI
jgi:hypothetical protein